MLVVCGPESASKLDSSLRTLVGNVPPKDCSWDFETIWETFRDFEAIFISHCHDKKPAISPSSIERVREITDNDWRFYFEPRQLLTVGIWSNHGFNMLIGSDVKNWDEYTKCTFSNLKFDVDSFKQFYLLAKRDGQVVETLLNKTSHRVVTSSPYKGVYVNIPLFKNVNVIFGQKGTGKTEILRSVKEHFDGAGVSVSSYFGSNRISEYDALLNAGNADRSCADFERDDGKKDIASILSWTDESPTSLSDYVGWKKTVGHNEKKDGFKLSDCHNLPEGTLEKYKSVSEDYATVSKFSNIYKERSLDRYLEKDTSESFIGMLSQMLSRAASERKSEYIEQESIRLANVAIGQIKTSIDNKSDTISKPGDVGFLRYAQNRIALLSAIKRIRNGIGKAERISDSYLGTLDNKGRLNIRLRRRYLCSDSRKEEFATGISKLKSWVESLEALENSVLTSDLPLKVLNFSEAHKAAGISDLSAFIGVTRFEIFEKNQKPYTPSSGEKGIILLERTLHADAEVYLLDEPELGMGNLYVDQVIRDRISKLAQRGKTIVIATHNANLAVRTLPYCSIYRKHINGDEYETYIGNPFVNELVCTSDDSRKEVWSEVSMETLEGGPEAFYDRRAIYEAGAK